MAPTEMVRYGPPLSLAQPCTPPGCLNLPSLEHVLTLNNVQQFIDIVKAVMAMEIATPPFSNCSYTAAEMPIPQAPAPPLTTGHLEQLISKLLKRKVPDLTGKSRDLQTVTPGANQPEDVVT